MPSPDPLAGGPDPSRPVRGTQTPAAIVAMLSPGLRWVYLRAQSRIGPPGAGLAASTTMASIDRTAYPRFTAQLSDRELDRDYSLSDPEQLFVRRQARGDTGRLSLALLLETRQRLGYFALLAEIPERVRTHLAQALGLAPATPVVDEIEPPATVHRYRTALREWLGSRPFSHGGRAIVTATVHRAAQTMSDPADLISASVEALVKHQVEVPAFATLDRLIGSLRQAIHEGLYSGIDAALDDDQRRLLDSLLVRANGARLNPSLDPTGRADPVRSG